MSNAAAGFIFSLFLLVTLRNLAFTSKRPGKTQQFNYYVVNDSDNEEGNRSGCPQNYQSDAFYMVDVPGLGYAEAPAKVREVRRGALKLFITLFSCNHTPRPKLLFLGQNIHRIGNVC